MWVCYVLQFKKCRNLVLQSNFNALKANVKNHFKSYKLVLNGFIFTIDLLGNSYGWLIGLEVNDQMTRWLC